MAPLPHAATTAFLSLMFTTLITGCSAIGFVGGTGVNALRGRESVELPPDSLFTLPDGSPLVLRLQDSTEIAARKLRPQPSDFDSASSAGAPIFLRVLRIAKDDAHRGDTLLVPRSQLAGGSVAVRHTADRTAAVAGAKADVVVLKVVVGLVLAGALIVGLFGLILSSSGFSF